MKIVISILFLTITLGFSKSENTMNTKGNMHAKNDTTELSCKLTSKELQLRKATVLASLRNQVLERKELQNGYAFRFNGSDKVIDELIEFVKTERQCCDFFTFSLSFSGDGREAWLEMTGPEGAKDFISSELGM